MKKNILIISILAALVFSACKVSVVLDVSDGSLDSGVVDASQDTGTDSSGDASTDGGVEQ